MLTTVVKIRFPELSTGQENPLDGPENLKHVKNRSGTFLQSIGQVFGQVSGHDWIHFWCFWRFPLPPTLCARRPEKRTQQAELVGKNTSMFVFVGPMP